MGRLLDKPQQITSLHLKAARIPQRYWTTATEKITPRAKAQAKAFLGSLQENLSEGRGLLVRGPLGTGKTSLAVAIGVEVLKHGGSVLFVSASDLVSLWMQDAVEFGVKTPQNFRERATSVSLLIVDDAGLIDNVKTLERVIRTRYDAKKSFILTTNWGKDVEELEHKLGKAVVSIAEEVTTTVLVNEKNWRKRLDT